MGKLESSTLICVCNVVVPRLTSERCIFRLKEGQIKDRVVLSWNVSAGSHLKDFSYCSPLKQYLEMIYFLN